MSIIKELMLSKRFWKIQFIALIGIAVSACTSVSPLYRAKVDDNSSSLYMASTTIRPSGWQNKNPDRGGAGVTFAYEHQSGDGEQTIYAPGLIQLESSNGSIVTLNGTQYLRNSASADHGHVAYNYLLNFGEHFSLEPEVGIGYDRMKLTIYNRASDAVTDTSRNFLNVTIGITPRWNIANHFAVEGRVRFGQGSGNTSLYNPALVYSPTPNISLALGYAWREQWYSGKGDHSSPTVASGDTSDVVLKFAGPSVGMHIRF